MGLSILDFPQELVQKVVQYATVGSPLGPPKELYNCLLVCRTFRDHLSPENAGELYAFIFAQKFDARAPKYRLSPTVLRENAPAEMRRRFSFIKMFKSRVLDDPSLTEALWMAYFMVEDTDTSQKNVKQLLRAGLPAFLDLYLRRRLYERAGENNGWPVLTEQNSLAIALSWTLASQSSLNREDRVTCDEMRDLLRPIVFAAFRYPIFHASEDTFGFSGIVEPDTPSTKSARNPPYPIAVFPPTEIEYFGTVKQKACPPAAALFAALLYFTRTESIAPFKAPKHIQYRTREEANLAGYNGICLEDYEHFCHHCRTRFADFPAIDVGIQSSALAASSDTTLCQASCYKLGTLSGQWQGSQIIPYTNNYQQWASGSPIPERFSPDEESRTPLYLTLEEHYCYDLKEAVPIDDVENGVKNAWLPEGLQANVTKDGMTFSNAKGTVNSFYQTYRRGQTPQRGQRHIVDVIITGKTDDQYARWGGGTVILGRVRIHDGLMVLVKALPDDPDNAQRELLRGYVTSSQNLVGKVKGAWTSAGSHYEGVFSLGKNYNTNRYV